MWPGPAILVAVCLTAPSRPGVSVVLTGDAQPVAAAREALGKPDVLPVDVRFSPVPNAPPADEGSGDTDARLAAARRDYVNASFRSCLERVPRGALVTGLLGADRPAVAARVLFWRVACQVGEGLLEEARVDARVFAALELEIPPDVEKASPEVETVLAQAMRDAAAAPRVPLRLSARLLAPPAAGAPPAEEVRAAVAVDGRPGLCTTPCELPRRPGDHVVRFEADGAAAEVQLVTAGPAGATLAAKLAVASPELAARQWTARYAGSASSDSSPSARLLAQALRDRRVALVIADAGSATTRLRGVLVIDGDVAARAERSGRASEIAQLAPELLRDLLVKGAVVEPPPPLYRQPLFWIVTGAVVAATAATTALIAYRPPIHTVVKF